MKRQTWSSEISSSRPFQRPLWLLLPPALPLPSAAKTLPGCLTCRNEGKHKSAWSLTAPQFATHFESAQDWVSHRGTDSHTGCRDAAASDAARYTNNSVSQIHELPLRSVGSSQKIHGEQYPGVQQIILKQPLISSRKREDRLVVG